jgi:hypothetical protein
VAPVPSAPRPRLRCPHTTEGWPALRRPRATDHPTPEGVRRARLPRRTAHRLRVAPCPPNAPAGLRLPRSPEGDRGPGLTRRPHRSPAAVADPSLPPTSRRSPTARSEVAVNTVRAPVPLRLVSGAGWAEAPSSPPRSAPLLSMPTSRHARPELGFRFGRVVSFAPLARFWRSRLNAREVTTNFPERSLELGTAFRSPTAIAFKECNPGGVNAPGLCLRSLGHT